VGVGTEMNDPPPESGPDEEAVGAPRWVKAFGLVVLVLVVLFVLAQLAGLGGDHGPGRHG